MAIAVICYETGDEFAYFETREEAIKDILEREADDRRGEVYEEGFYGVRDVSDPNGWDERCVNGELVQYH